MWRTDDRDAGVPVGAAVPGVCGDEPVRGALVMGGDVPTQRLMPPGGLAGLLQRVHDTRWELHDIGWSLRRGVADAEDVRYTAAMLRDLAGILDEHGEGMPR